MPHYDKPTADAEVQQYFIDYGVTDDETRKLVTFGFENITFNLFQQTRQRHPTIVQYLLYYNSKRPAYWSILYNDGYSPITRNISEEAGNSIKEVLSDLYPEAEVQAFVANSREKAAKLAERWKADPPKVKSWLHESIMINRLKLPDEFM